jgi:hypothetical protein
MLIEPGKKQFIFPSDYINDQRFAAAGNQFPD